jgi:cytochrome P450
MRRDPISFLSYVARRYGDLTHFRVGKQHVYLLNHPDYLRPVLLTDADKFVKSSGSQRAKALIGDGLLTSEGEKHRRQRRLIQPAFQHRKLVTYAPTVVECGLAHADTWRDQQQVEMVEEMRRLTLKIIGKTMFGVDIGAETGAAITDFMSMVRLFDSMTPVMALIRRLSLRKKGFSQGRIRHQAVMRIIEKRRKNPTAGDDFLSTLIRAVDQNAAETGMTEKQLRDEVMTILEAGHETTTTALGWTWYLLSENPEAEQKMHRELDQVLNGRPPTAEDLAQLPYTVNVFNEAIRLFPPAWVIGRTPINDYELNGYTFPAGSLVLMSQYVMHHDERFFAEAERFSPERWSTQGKSPASLAYFPFGNGPRRCIGDGFAMLEGGLLLATLGSRWRAKLIPGHTVKKVPLIILRPDRLPMVLERRSASSC